MYHRQSTHLNRFEIELVIRIRRLKFTFVALFHLSGGLITVLDARNYELSE